MRLYHFSEDPEIKIFVPHVAKTSATTDAYVWAIDEEHAPSYWFPRDCPLVCCWTNAEVREHAVLSSGTQRMHAIEIAWLTNVRQCVLYAYALSLKQAHQFGKIDFQQLNSTIESPSRTLWTARRNHNSVSRLSPLN